MSLQEIKLPDLGEGVKGGDVIQVLVSPGDVVKPEQTVAEVETDKAVLEVPCPVAGRVVQVSVAQGDHIAVGQTLISVETDVTAAVAATLPAAGPAPAADRVARPSAPHVAAPVEEPAPAAGPVRASSAASLVAPAGPAREEAPIAAGPATRRLARELGVDLRVIAQSHPDTRITDEMVKAFVKQAMTTGTAAAAGGGTRAVAAPALPDFSQWGPVDRVPFSSLQRKTAEALSVGWSLAPHVTQFEQCDITRVEVLRKRFRDTPQGKEAKLTVTAFVLKALTTVLKAHPQFNASFEHRTNELILKRYYHIGVAVDTEAGLIVPVLRDVDRKSVLQIAAEMNELAERTRKRKVGLDELKGGTFTVTNLGGIGGTAFTPIINYPEVAILGLARSKEEPAVVDGKLTTRLMLPLCLSYDHRVINGADGARFIRKLSGLLEDPEVLLLGA
ncbi:MAG TPA: 2-oxo acid dehydrogenase subunit E2 [Phycisphaerae bacterium]|nr:2-oxo acid dehydrogenase subunit E2 [Phycisphaerae bacterium]HRY68542.1 2-oxo acid dehydrogenase subunit E2 [Phycisphaerae bacterium]HSA25590.1 2-oxo acid dehydrogenase subunit E2 [Phycisphaerae bacterium]